MHRNRKIILGGNTGNGEVANLKAQAKVRISFRGNDLENPA